MTTKPNPPYFYLFKFYSFVLQLIQILPHTLFIICTVVYLLPKMISDQNIQQFSSIYCTVLTLYCNVHYLYCVQSVLQSVYFQRCFGNNHPTQCHWCHHHNGGLMYFDSYCTIFQKIVQKNQSHACLILCKKVDRCISANKICLQRPESILGKIKYYTPYLVH